MGTCLGARENAIKCDKCLNLSKLDQIQEIHRLISSTGRCLSERSTSKIKRRKPLLTLATLTLYSFLPYTLYVDPHLLLLRHCLLCVLVVGVVLVVVLVSPRRWWQQCVMYVGCLFSMSSTDTIFCMLRCAHCLCGWLGLVVLVRCLDWIGLDVEWPGL